MLCLPRARASWLPLGLHSSPVSYPCLLLVACLGAAAGPTAVIAIIPIFTHQYISLFSHLQLPSWPLSLISYQNEYNNSLCLPFVFNVVYVSHITTHDHAFVLFSLPTFMNDVLQSCPVAVLRCTNKERKLKEKKRRLNLRR